jgi:dolichol-phosphate mannosyltransferase
MIETKNDRPGADTSSLARKNPGRPRLGVVVPLANEEGTIDELLDRLLPKTEPNDIIFCVLDRTSQDSTRQRVETRAATDSRIALIWAPENRCVVDAYFRGYKEALAAGCDWILEMDGGLSHAPEQIPRFLQAMQEGFDFAAGSRFIRGGSHTGSWLRYLLSRGGTLLTNLLLRTKMCDMTSGFECFTRRAMSLVVEQGVKSKGTFFQTEIRYTLRNSSWVEIPIDYVCTCNSVGQDGILESISILWTLFRQRQRAHQEEERD